MRMRTAYLDVEQTSEPSVVTDADGNSVITVKLSTSTDVDSLVICDEDGNPVTIADIEYTSQYLEDEGIVEWTVTLTTSESGSFTWLVSGVYSNGYTDYQGAATVVVTVEKPVDEEVTDNVTDDSGSVSDGTIFDTLKGIYNRFIEFIRAVLALFGIIV